MAAKLPLHRVLTESVCTLGDALLYIKREYPFFTPSNSPTSTIWRWCTTCHRSGERLEHIKLGARLLTSTEAVDRFVARCLVTASGYQEGDDPRGAAKAQRVVKAKRKLSRAGA